MVERHYTFRRDMSQPPDKHALLIERQHIFFAKVRIAHQDDCWMWQGSTDGRGYGKFLLQKGRFRVSYKAHQTALILSGSARPEGMSALHSCDVPLCCNPRHLRWGTVRDNSHDAMARGQQISGERHGRHRLTEAMVRQIRRDPRTCVEIAREFGVDSNTVDDARRGRTWKHVV